MKAYEGVGMSCACCWIEMIGQLHPLAALPQLKVIQVSIEQEAHWASEPDWMLWREEKSLALHRNQTMIPRSCST
jgi:hypothetical protein